MLALAGVTFICPGLWVEMGPRKEALSHDRPIALTALGALATAFSTLSSVGTGDYPGHTEGTCVC